jgi:DNA-binding NarL/FixJ family response regulator
MIVEADANDRNNTRVALKALGYTNYTDAPNHLAALEKMRERPVTHIIFDAKKTNMPTNEFLQKVFEMDKKIIAIPSSYEPNVDDVFDLMVTGARGFVSKPVTSDSLDSAIVMASKGDPISEVVLHAKDRNEALVALCMASLDKAATILRQSTQFETAKREIPRALASLNRSAEMARTFCKGGEEGLLNAIEAFCLERSKGPATKLGRLRQRLKSDRNVPEKDAPQ